MPSFSCVAVQMNGENVTLSDEEGERQNYTDEAPIVSAKNASHRVNFSILEEWNNGTIQCSVYFQSKAQPIVANLARNIPDYRDTWTSARIQFMCKYSNSFHIFDFS